MNRKEIIKMAREAGFGMYAYEASTIFERFAALVAAHEREQCAKVVESAIPFGKILDTAAAIRARGTEK